MPDDYGGKKRAVSVWKYGQQVGDLSFELLREYYKYYLLMSANPLAHIIYMRPCFTALKCVYSQVRPMLILEIREQMDKKFKDTRTHMEEYLLLLQEGRISPTYEVLLELELLHDNTLSNMQSVGMWVASEKYISEKERLDTAYGVRKRKTQIGSENNPL